MRSSPLRRRWPRPSRTCGLCFRRPVRRPLAEGRAKKELRCTTPGKHKAKTCFSTPQRKISVLPPFRGRTKLLGPSRSPGKHQQQCCSLFPLADTAMRARPVGTVLFPFPSFSRRQRDTGSQIISARIPSPFRIAPQMEGQDGNDLMAFLDSNMIGSFSDMQ